jgi:hypothetical protein
MKTYRDLKWWQHQHWERAKYAVLHFDNGYGLSIISGWDGSPGFFRGPYAGADTYEAAVIKQAEDGEYDLCYDTHLTDDVLKYLTEDELIHVIDEVQQL